MKRYHFITSTLLSILFVFFLGPVFAQEVTTLPTISLENPVGCRPLTYSCATVTRNSNRATDTRMTVTAQGLEPGSQAYLVCGILPDAQEVNSVGWQVTSGNDETDEKILCLGKNNATNLKKVNRSLNTPYNLTIQGGNPITVSQDGTISVQINSAANAWSATHSCFVAVPQPITETGGNESSMSLQYETFRFAQAQSTCNSVRADPYGRVFDAATLKPLPNAVVTILDSNKAKLNVFGIPNPVTLDNDGMFTFLVDPGTYYLTSALENAQAHQNYALAYSNLYTYDSPIEEDGSLIQKDIPVTYANNTKYTPKLTLMDFGTMQLGFYMRIEGKASWPLTFVSVFQGEKKLHEIQANKFGGFVVDVANDLIDPAQEITVQLTEVDLTKDPSSPVAGGEQIEQKTDPIPTYLEGYAYDAAGKIIPNAIVSVKLTFNDAVYFKTTADETGFFKIERKNLPVIPFYLEYTGGISGTNTPLKTAVPKFAQGNTEYLTQKGIQLTAGTVNGVLVDKVLKAVKESTAQNQQGQNGQTDGQNQPGTQEGNTLPGGGVNPANPLGGNSSQSQLLVIVILLVIATILVIYLIKRYKKLKASVPQDEEEK